MLGRDEARLALGDDRMLEGGVNMRWGRVEKGLGWLLGQLGCSCSSKRWP